MPDGCCPAGNQECGTTGCYNPAREKCCSDGVRACSLDEDCVQGGCCPAGYRLCSGSNVCVDPKTEKCCGSGAQSWGCPASSGCCSPGCYDLATERCCTGGLCWREETCCMSQCCKSTAYCGSDGLCYRSSTPTSAHTRATLPASSATVGTTAKPVPSGAPSSVVAQTATRTISFVYDDSRRVSIKRGPNAGKTISAPPKAVKIQFNHAFADLFTGLS